MEITRTDKRQTGNAIINASRIRPVFLTNFLFRTCLGDFRSPGARLQAKHEGELDDPLEHGIRAPSGVVPEEIGLLDNATSKDKLIDQTFDDGDDLDWPFPKVNQYERFRRPSKRGRALLLQIAIVSVILVANLSLTVFAMTYFDNGDNGVSLIYEGDCTTVGRLDQWLHLLINLLSTGMLSASNYCMQLQAAPTRADVNCAHERNVWLDIGVPSVRNLSYVGNWRRLSWALLALSSLPIHLLYNSAVFQSLPSYDYTIAVVKDSFLDPASTWSLATAEANRHGDPGWDYSWVNPTGLNYSQIIRDMQIDASATPYTNMSVADCFALYDDYFAPQGNALIFVKNETIQTSANDSLLLYVSVVPRPDDWGKNMWALSNGTGDFVELSPPGPVTTLFLGPPRYEAAYCLVQPPAASAATCRFEYSPDIMLTVCFLNTVKLCVMLFVWLLSVWQDRERNAAQKERLYTLGDAIASFMREPDPTTRDMCLATKEDFLSRRRWKTRLVKKEPELCRDAREWRYEPQRWMSAAGAGQWTVLLSVCFVIVLVATVLFYRICTTLQHRNMSTSLASITAMGFGQLQPYNYLAISLPLASLTGLLINVLVANLPQLVLSLVYVLYNAMLSTYLVQLEFSLMHRKYKPLRVSEPQGMQRSSYFISLPLRYGLPLYLASGLMHWLASQGFFLARITALHPDGSIDDENSFSTCGYSPLAVLITIIFGVMLVAAIVALGFRRYDGTMRMVGTNSRAISAACHALEQDRAHGYLLPLRWGLVSRVDGIGHCAFTGATDRGILLPYPGERCK